MPYKVFIIEYENDEERIIWCKSELYAGFEVFQAVFDAISYLISEIGIDPRDIVVDHRYLPLRAEVYINGKLKYVIGNEYY